MPSYLGFAEIGRHYPGLGGARSCLAYAALSCSKVTTTAPSDEGQTTDGSVLRGYDLVSVTRQCFCLRTERRFHTDGSYGFVPEG